MLNISEMRMVNEEAYIQKPGDPTPGIVIGPFDDMVR